MPRQKKFIEPEPVVVPEPEDHAISVDLGNGYSNLMADGGISDDWRSAYGRFGNATQMNNPPAHSIISIDGDTYVFGEDAYKYAPNDIEDFPNLDRYISQWYKKLFAFALYRAYGNRIEQSPICPRVIASIPAKEFKIKSRVAKVKRNLSGFYAIGTLYGQTLQVDVLDSNLTIIPEGAGSYLYACQASALSGQTPYATGLWFVLDIGYLTGDCVAFQDGEYIADLSISDDSIGIHYVAQAISDYIRSEGGPSLDPAEFDTKLRCDTIPVGNRMYDIRAPKAKALAVIGDRAGRFIKRATANRNVSGVLHAGGGQEYITGYITGDDMPLIVPVTNPRRSNVEGAFHLLAG